MNLEPSNCERFAAVPLTMRGTATADWLAQKGFPTLDTDDCPGLVIIAAHPDDETLGLGALAALLAARGVPLRVVVATDGGGAYPQLSPLERQHLERCRRAELATATGLLGLGPPTLLGLPDGRIAEHEAELAALLLDELRACPGAWCATTWRGDGHPDHEAVGRAAALAARDCGRVLLEYPIWMWHWAVPGDTAVPWHRMFSVPTTRAARRRKHLAARVFTSQLRPPRVGGAPVLPPFVVRRLLAVGEVVLR